MPIYEFYCPDNHTVYQFLARSLAYGGKVPCCPDDPNFRMEKRVSKFAFIKGTAEPVGNDPFGNLDDHQMEALMADMEKDMGGMDEANPDPKQLSHFMRKMTDMMGDKAPPEMREMIRRLESGADPESLEAEFGSMTDENGEPDFFSQAVNKIKAMRPPKRDAKLYEMSEYIV